MALGAGPTSVPITARGDAKVIAKFGVRHVRTVTLGLVLVRPLSRRFVVGLGERPATSPRQDRWRFAGRAAHVGAGRQKEERHAVVTAARCAGACSCSTCTRRAPNRARTFESYQAISARAVR